MTLPTLREIRRHNEDREAQMRTFALVQWSNLAIVASGIILCILTVIHGILGVKPRTVFGHAHGLASVFRARNGVDHIGVGHRGYLPRHLSAVGPVVHRSSPNIVAAASLFDWRKAMPVRWFVDGRRCLPSLCSDLVRKAIPRLSRVGSEIKLSHRRDHEAVADIERRYVVRNPSSRLGPGLASHHQAGDACRRCQIQRRSGDGCPRKFIYEEFILPFDIDMTEYERRNYLHYKTVNDWFARSIRPDRRRRPVGVGLVSVADSRVLVMQNLNSDSFLWLKHEQISMRDLLGRQFPARHLHFHEATAIVHRLAPQDYHRVHSPIDLRAHHSPVRIVPQFPFSESTRYAIVQCLNNTRVVTVIRTGSHRITAVVSIGARPSDLLSR